MEGPSNARIDDADANNNANAIHHMLPYTTVDGVQYRAAVLQLT